MKFLIDEMFGPAAVARLTAVGHDAVHVHDVGLGGAPDSDVLAHASEANRVVATENAVDFIPLLDARTAAGLLVTPVVIALKRKLPSGAGAMNHALAEKLDDWAKHNPDPYRHVHWLS